MCYDFGGVSYLLIKIIVCKVWSVEQYIEFRLAFKSYKTGNIPENPETPIRKYLCTPKFRAVLFTVVKIWKQLKCPSEDEHIKKYCGTVTQQNATQQKERTPTFCHSMDGTGEHYAK